MLKKHERGFEPDGCYYFTNVERMRAKKRIDLTKDPVPDLAIEVDISSPSISRFPIFARLGVQEVWRYHKGRVAIYEVMDVSSKIREMVLAGSSGPEIKKQAVKDGMKTLRMSALTKMAEGVTSIEEALMNTAEA